MKDLILCAKIASDRGNELDACKRNINEKRCKKDLISVTFYYSQPKIKLRHHEPNENTKTNTLKAFPLYFKTRLFEVACVEA